jgi:uncharacterized membrane protein (UPF0127 family)
MGVLMGLLSGGCSEAEKTPVTPVKTIADHFVVKLGNTPAQLQIAVSGAEQQRGLMFRRDLGADEGMIFVYGAPQAMSFWMRNTPSPLDIGFFDREGVLLEIYPLLPFDETPVKSRSNQIRYAVEMKQGWYASHGVKPGDKMDLDALSQALKARGFKPGDWVLR